MLTNMSLRSRLTLVVIVALLGMVLLAVLSAFSTRSLMLEERKGLARGVTQSVYNIIAFYHAQEVAGKMTREEAQNLAKEATRQARFNGEDGKSDYFYIWTPDGINVVHALKPEWEGKPMGSQVKDGNGQLVINNLAAALRNNSTAFVDTMFLKKTTDPTMYPKILYAQRFDPWNWLVGTGVYIDEVDKEFREVLIRQLLYAMIPMLVIGFVCILVARSVLGQIGGEPSAATEVMRRIAAGDLTTRLEQAPRGSLLAALGEMVQALRNMLDEIRQDAGSLVRSAESISTASGQVAATAASQADATSSMAAAIEELTVSSTHISDSATETQQDAHASVENSKQGRGRAESAAEAMQRISATVAEGSARIRTLDDRANQISSIAGVIKEIAGQTNLLALNAAIEAARAGEQGRGFAVVADEVRKLAERTSSATVEIEQMIAGIQGETDSAVQAMDDALPQVEQGVTLAKEAAESLAAIEAGATRSLEHIRDVADATREQSAASTSIAQRVEAIAQMVEETSSTMHQTADSARELERVAHNLQQMVGRFRT